MKPFNLVFAALAVTLSGCAASAAAFGPPMGTIAGHVSVRACGGAYKSPDLGGTPCQPRPAPGVTVTLDRQGGGQKLTAITNADGAYSIKVPVGRYTVQVGRSAGGKQPPLPAADSRAFADRAMAMSLVGPKTVTVANGQTVTADFIIIYNLL